MRPICQLCQSLCGRMIDRSLKNKTKATMSKASLRWMGKVAAAFVLATALDGCASYASTGSAAISALSAINPVDLTVGAGAAWVVYVFSQTPSWSARVESTGSQSAEVELEKSMFAQGGDGAAGMVFAMSGKRWCKEHGGGTPLTLEFVEYWEPMVIGVRRKARGEFRCVP